MEVLPFLIYQGSHLYPKTKYQESGGTFIVSEHILKPISPTEHFLFRSLWTESLAQNNFVLYNELANYWKLHEKIAGASWFQRNSIVKFVRKCGTFIDLNLLVSEFPWFWSEW